MRQFLFSFIIALVLPTGACTASDVGARGGDNLISAQLATADVAAARDDPADVVISLEPAMTDDIFKQLSGPTQYKVASLYGSAAERIGQGPQAHQAFVRATANSLATGADWNQRMQSAIFVSDGQDAYACFLLLTRRRDPLVGTFGSWQLSRFEQLVEQLPNAREAQLAIGRRMEWEDWQPADAYDDASNVWLPYVEALVEQGDIAKAAAVAARITDPLILVAMQSDRRFDALVATNPSLFDPDAAAQRRLDQAKRASEQYPNYLSPKIAIVRALDILDRRAEALAIADDAARALAHESPGRPAFPDADQARVIVDERSEDLLVLGRADEAIGALAVTAQRSGASYAVLSLGLALEKAGRGDEALNWLRGARMDNMSLQEQMNLVQVTACADAEAGDQAELRKQLDILGAHEAWSPRAIVEGLVCANQFDQAAIELERQLADPRQRLSALASLQVYASEAKPLAHTKLMEQRWVMLRARPDLQAAVAKVGRTKTYQLLPLLPEF
ncbi:MAG TPA: hypothetical protein VGI79_00620 [Caulobacteraceae bacterium]|jgi:hypothetical protein